MTRFQRTNHFQTEIDKVLINCCIETYNINGNDGEIPFNLYSIEILPDIIKEHPDLKLETHHNPLNVGFPNGTILKGIERSNACKSFIPLLENVYNEPINSDKIKWESILNI